MSDGIPSQDVEMGEVAEVEGQEVRDHMGDMADPTPGDDGSIDIGLLTPREEPKPIIEAQQPNIKKFAKIAAVVCVVLTVGIIVGVVMLSGSDSPPPPPPSPPPTPPPTSPPEISPGPPTPAPKPMYEPIPAPLPPPPIPIPPVPKPVPVPLPPMPVPVPHPPVPAPVPKPAPVPSPRSAPVPQAPSPQAPAPAAPAAPVGPVRVWDHIRLPEWLQAWHYELKMSINVADEGPRDDGAWAFGGENQFTFMIFTESMVVPFHLGKVIPDMDPPKTITCQGVQAPAGGPRFAWDDKIVTQGPEMVINVNTTTYNKTFELWSVILNKPIPKNSQCKMQVGWKGKVDKLMSGIYYSDFIDPDTKQTEFMVLTDFEPTGARATFPCFDEPAQKARFNTSIVVPANYSALANMDDLPGYPLDVAANPPVHPNASKEHRFAQTPFMSTYLICFVVSKFEHHDEAPPTPDMVPVSVYGRRQYKDQFEFAAKEAQKIIHFYSKFYDIAYPLPKMKMVAIPDYPQGAMENWGLITYRESYQLYSKDESTTANKQSIASVISHELAHQWFGNLVTMEWWNDLWLNEGFAEYVQHLGVNSTNPEWNIMEEVAQLHSRAFAVDHSLSSRTLSHDVEFPGEAAAMFDTITYQKGSSMLNMVSRLLDKKRPGEHLFQSGLQGYLQRYKFSNAARGNLWDAIDEQLTKSKVKDLTMANMTRVWIDHKGFPVISFKIEPKTPQTPKPKISLSQSWCLSKKDKAQAMNESDNPVWWVPIQINFGAEAEKALVDADMAYTNSTVVPATCSQGCDASDPSLQLILVNPGATGYYMVDYPQDLWDNWRKELAMKDSKAALPIDHANFVLTGWGLSWVEPTDQTRFCRALGMTTTLAPHVHEHTPWGEGVGALSSIYHILYNSGAPNLNESQTAWTAYSFNLVNLTLNSIGWEPALKEPETTMITRSMLFYRAVLDAPGKEALPKSVQDNLVRLNSTKANGHFLSPDLRGSYYYAFVRFGGESEYQMVLSQAKNASVSSRQEHIRYMRALAATTNPTHLTELLQLAILTRPDWIDDSPSVVGSVARNPTSGSQAWDFMKTNWNNITKEYDLGGGPMRRFVSYSIGSFGTDTLKKDVADFAKKENSKDLKDVWTKALDKIQTHIDWISAHCSTPTQLADTLNKCS